MKIPKQVYDDFNRFDKNRNGTIEQQEIDALKGSGTVFDTSLYSFYKVRNGMDISLFIKENRACYGTEVQFTENEYTEGRKILENKKLILTDKTRKSGKDNSESIQVEQGEFAVKTFSKESPSLQTYNIRNCVALTIYDKKTKRGFLAHIDSIERAESLESILKNCKFNLKTSEARIIGGLTNFSEGVIELIDETVKKFNIKVAELDVLGKPTECRRDIQLDLKTGEVLDYTETNPNYKIAYDNRTEKQSLIQNKLSE